MARTTCPFCFYEIDSSKLGYLCARQGHIKCPPVIDPERREITGSGVASGRYLPPEPTVRKGIARCENCQGETRRRACPKCHTGLSIDFVDTKNPMLGMVGSKGSGKTVLMTVMIQQLRKVVARRFDADIAIAVDNPDGMNSISEYMKGREQAIYKDGTLPGGTGTFEADGRIPIVLRWRADRKSTMLAFLDSAGEDFTSGESVSAVRYLHACRYLMVALDPFSLPGARASLNLPPQALQSTTDNAAFHALEQVTQQLRTHHQLRPGKLLSTDVSFVFTKLDAFFPTLEEGDPLMATAPPVAAYDEGDGMAVHEQMRTLLKEWDAEEIDRHVSRNYASYRYFGVSALGGQPSFDSAKGWQVAAGGVRPHRVEDPILWLMSKAKMVRTVKPK